MFILCVRFGVLKQKALAQKVLNLRKMSRFQSVDFYYEFNFDNNIFSTGLLNEVLVLKMGERVSLNKRIGG